MRLSVFFIALRTAAAWLPDPAAAIDDNAAVAAISARRLPSRYAAMQELLGRQVSECASGWHNCADVEREADCCPDDRVCFINNVDKSTGCCAIGVPCPEQAANCNITSNYECNRTATITEGGTVTTTVEPYCCPRRCPNSSPTRKFMCATSLWPNTASPRCCPVGNLCGTGNICFFTSSSTTPGARPTGGSGGGGGAGGGAGGATPSPSTTSSGPNEPSVVPQDTGLSTGAKAGIGAGVAIGASILIGAATYFCVRQRRRAASSRGRGSVVTYTYGGDQSGGPHSGRAGRGGLTLGSGFSSAGGGRHDTFPLSTAPGSTGIQSGAMSETTEGEGRLRGIATDYFGPNAAVGPLTDMDAAGVRGSAGTSPGIDGGVPRVPLHPGHIVAPVEIDSKETPIKENGRPGENGSRRVSYLGNTAVTETIDGRFELYSDDPPRPPAGWEGSPLVFHGEQVQEQAEPVRVEDEAGTIPAEGMPFLSPREAPASPRSLSPGDVVSPRSISPVEPPSGHSNLPPGQGQGGSGAQHGTT